MYFYCIKNTHSVANQQHSNEKSTNIISTTHPRQINGTSTNDLDLRAAFYINYVIYQRYIVIVVKINTDSSATHPQRVINDVGLSHVQGTRADNDSSPPPLPPLPPPPHPPPSLHTQPSGRRRQMEPMRSRGVGRVSAASWCSLFAVSDS